MHKHRIRHAEASPHHFGLMSQKPDLRIHQKETYYVCGILKRKEDGTSMYFAVRLSGNEAKRIADLDSALAGGAADNALRNERARMLGRGYYFRVAKEGEYKMNQAVEGYPADWQPYS